MPTRRKLKTSRGNNGFICITLSLLLPSIAFLFFSGSFYTPWVSTPSLKELPWLHKCKDGHFISTCGAADLRKPDTINTTTDFFLAAVIINRVFGSDLFGIGPYECRQWLEYMIYAGVEHIFWYDTAHNNAESQREYLRPFSDAGLVTYNRFHHDFPDSLTLGFHFEQDSSYVHFLSNYRNRSKWIIQIDVDEYPFSGMDMNSCFLSRFVREYELNVPNITQMLLQSMVFSGNPKGNVGNGWIVEIYQRRKPDTEGVVTGHQSRHKPIYRADLCGGIVKENPHVVVMEVGKTTVANANQMRINHYWGAREFGFRPDTLESTAMLVYDNSVQYVVNRIKQATGLVSRNNDMIGFIIRWIARG